MTATRRPNLYHRFHRLIFRMSRRLPVADFDVRMLIPLGDEAQCATERVASALSLIRAVAPTRYSCLRRDLPRIFLGGTHNLGECHFPTGICLLQSEYVVAPTTTPERLALLLMHEGMHARLHRAGFTYDEPRRARIERLCVTAEMLLARRLPNAEALVAEIEAGLPSASDPHWTNEAMFQRRLDALMERGRLGRFWARILRGLKPLIRRRWAHAA